MRWWTIVPDRVSSYTQRDNIFSAATDALYDLHDNEAMLLNA